MIAAQPPVFAPESVAASANAEATAIESNVGLKWINRIGVVTVLIGIVFFFKYAVDNEWVGPAGRVLIGVFTGLLALLAGDRLWHRGQEVFAQGVQALGSAVLYLSFFAAYSFYDLIPQAAAFVLLLATTALTGALSLRYNARTPLLLALFGAYMTPFLLSKGEPNDLFFLCYMLMVNAAAMFVARMKDWKSVETIALLGMWILNMAWNGDRASKAGRHLGVVFTALNWAVCAASPNVWVPMLAQFGASISLGIAFEEQWEGGVQLMLVALFFAGLAVSWVKKLPFGAGVALLSYWVGVAVVSAPRIAEHVTELALCYTVVHLGVFAWTAVRASSATGSQTKSDLLSVAASGAIYFGAMYALLRTEYSAYLGLFTVAVAASYLLLGYLLYRGVPAENRDLSGPLLAAGLALAFLALAVPIQLTGYRITIGWAIQSAALTWIAYKLKDWRVLLASGFLAFLAIARLAGEDAMLYWPPIEGGYTLLLNPRFVSFFAVFVSLMLSAYWMSKMPEVPKQGAAVPYLLSHLFFIWGLHLELFAYIDSRTDLASPTSLKALISSLILAGYGFQFIASGFARRAAFPRILGLILFGIVIVKLYIYDIWLLAVGYRMVAFIALGAMLLAGSYLYSRFRDKLSTLIRDA
ncbi:hypothetical protein F183_A47980 [Bryobacterales bacterium F-183]|nr:hypothetical protein F183_A47980 [Bryobacterales bacterium F-183]